MVIKSISLCLVGEGSDIPPANIPRALAAGTALKSGNASVVLPFGSVKKF